MKIDTTKKTILGIDPGTLVMGFGIIEQSGSQLCYKDMGVLNLKKETDPLVKLLRIHQEINRLIDLYKPSQVSIEAPFYGKNPQSLIKLGRAQGVAIAAAMNRGLEVFEYAPLKIKQSITGNGKASKEQVCQMLFALLHINEQKPSLLDASDALGAAVCHALQNKYSTCSTSDIDLSKAVCKHKKKPSWESFLLQNPNRVKK